MVVRAALELLNKVGMDGLTTRRLAQELGVKGPALYWHFKNKQELIDEMARALIADAYGSVKPGLNWEVWLTQGARRMRRSLLSYRDGARLLAGFRPSGPHGRIEGAKMFGPLIEAGFPEPDAFWAMLAVALFTFGWTMDEQAAVERQVWQPPKARMNAGFEYGLQTIMIGLKARLREGAAICSRPELEPLAEAAGSAAAPFKP